MMLGDSEFLMRHLIIGAGPVGLAMAAALKSEGVAYDQIDANAGLGGNWYKGVYKDVYLLSSKSSSAYADYPMPADYPEFPSAAQVLRYLRDYAQARGIDKGIEYNKAVDRAVPQSDDSWLVTFADGEQRRYKGIVVCNGHHWDPRIPQYPGTFDGEFIHSKDYHDGSQLAGKRVLVLGGGNSGSEIACEAARVGMSSDISLRGGQWFMPKTAFGKPLTDLKLWYLPQPLQKLLLRGIVWTHFGDYRKYGLQWPTHGMFDRHTAFGTEIMAYLERGRIKPRREIERFDGKTVEFKDGSSGQYDIIVAATGYRNSFPFLPEGLIDVKGDIVQIYAGAFPDKVKNLYIIGSQQPRGGFGSLLTPAAKLYAHMIRRQDEFGHPWGFVLRHQLERPSKTQFLDPVWSRLRIGAGWRTIPLSIQLAKWLDRRYPREPLPDFVRDDTAIATDSDSPQTEKHEAA